jgi:hypothetical protein
MTKNTFCCQTYFCLKLGCYPLKLNVEFQSFYILCLWLVIMNMFPYKKGCYLWNEMIEVFMQSFIITFFFIYYTFFSCHVIEIQVSVRCAQGTYFDMFSGCKMSCAPRSTLTTIANT